MASDGHSYQAKDSVSKYGYADVQSKHLKIYKRRWLVLYRGISSYPAALVKYKDENHFKNNKERAKYLMPNFLSVERLLEDQKKYVVIINLKDEKENDAGILTVKFSCSSDTEANDWVDHIKTEMEHLSSNNDEFPVYLVPNAILNDKGEMVMRVRNGWVSLLNSDNRLITEWSIRRIRRYKEDNVNTFWIECGRSSSFGEGRLTFTSTCIHSILQRIHDEALKITAQLSSPYSKYLPESDICDLSMPCTIDPRTQTLMRRPPLKVDCALGKGTFKSVPDLRQNYNNEFEPESPNTFLSVSPNYSVLEKTTYAHGDCLTKKWFTIDKDRDSGYIDMNPDHRPKRRVTLPSPPTLSELTSETHPLQYNRLFHSESFPKYSPSSAPESDVHQQTSQTVQPDQDTESSPGGGKTRCLTSPRLDDIPENGSHFPLLTEVLDPKQLPEKTVRLNSPRTSSEFCGVSINEEEIPALPKRNPKSKEVRPDSQ